MKEIKLYKLRDYLDFIKDYTGLVRIGNFKSEHDRKMYGVVTVTLNQLFYGSPEYAADKLSDDILNTMILSVMPNINEWEEWICLDSILCDDMRQVIVEPLKEE